MSSKDALVFIKHIIDNIEKAEIFSKGLTKETLSKNELKQYAIVRSIEVIGEAVKNIPPSIKNKYPNVPWKDISGTRDILIHHYFGVDLNIVWDIIKKELPKLNKNIPPVFNWWSSLCWTSSGIFLFSEIRPSDRRERAIPQSPI